MQSSGYTWPRLHPCLRPAGLWTRERCGRRDRTLCRQAKALRLHVFTACSCPGAVWIAEAELPLFADHSQGSTLAATSGVLFRNADYLTGRSKNQWISLSPIVTKPCRR
jgi:hypothetical protein